MKKVVGIIFAYTALVLVVCLGLSALIGHLPALLEEYKRQYIICRGFLYFLRILPAVFCSAEIIAFSVHFGADSKKAQMRFSPIIMRHFRIVMIVSLVLVSLTALGREVAAPVLQEKKERAENAPRLLSEYIRLGNECLNEENYILAHRYGSQVLRIRPSSQEGKELIDKSEAVIKAIRKITPADVKTPAETQSIEEIGEETVASLINKSKIAAEKGNWFNSHYYAQLALSAGTDKDINIDEVRRLASVAWNKLQSINVEEKTNDQILFEKKRKAYKALAEGDNIDAYYQFLGIAAEDITWSSDPDVNQFLKIAESRVLKQCFFIDETEKLEAFEYYTDVYFTVKRASGMTDVVYIRGITPMENTGGMVEYLRGLTITTFGKSGNFVKSLRVPYAKMMSMDANLFDTETKERLEIPENAKRIPYILLESIDRSKREIRISPEYEFSDSVHPNQQTKPNFTVLSMPSKDFKTACEMKDGAERMSLASLVDAAGKADSLGYCREVEGAFLIRRVTFPLVMLVILVFLSGVAWNFRTMEEQLFKFRWIVIVPVCTAACDVLIQIVATLNTLAGFALVSAAGEASLLVSFAVWLALLFAASLFFVMRKAD